MTTDQQRASFFRQSGWMVIATFAGGACMFAVHVFAPYMGDTEYGLFGTLLAIMNVMLIPALGLQTTFVQQAAAALTPPDFARLAAATRALLAWTFALWLAVALGVAIFSRSLMDLLTIANPMALVLVMLIGLASLWQPILMGVLQGRQNFIWMGWALIANGAGRFLAVAVIVVWLGGKATGAIGGALIGVGLLVAIGFWQSRAVWGARERLPFDARGLLVNIVPLSLGLGTSQLIFSVDMILVRAIYGEQGTGFYSASGMIGRGLVMFTAPLVLVMFPKIVHGHATGRKSNVLALTLIGTGLLGTLCAGGSTAVAWVLRHVAADPTWGAGWLPAALLAKLNQHPDATLRLGELIPWFVWCMLPLALANVLLNNLMAARRYRVVPAMLVLVAAYVTTVVSCARSFTGVVQILGLYNLLLLGLLGAYTWWESRPATRP